jgi:predicted phage tail protein
MSDSSNSPVTRNTLARQGVQGVVSAAGGIVMLAASRGGLLSIVLGALVIAAGFALTSSRSDRTAGLVAIAAGVVTLAGGIFSKLSWLLWPMLAAGLALLGLGGYWIWKFVANLRTRM